MGRKSKYSAELKLRAVELYKSGELSLSQIASKLSIALTSKTQILKWVHQYDKTGPSMFDNNPRNQSYSKEFKEQVCLEYLSGTASLTALAYEYGIPSHKTVGSWVKSYTGSQNKLRDYDPKPEVYMTASRKTTLEERKEIVQWYHDNGKSYKDTAAHFNCSYSQVRSWVLKMKESGVEGLIDRRGRNKPEEELSKYEQLERKYKLVEALNQRLMMENELLKKVKELERRR
jgi:transposase-like protein